MKKQSAWKFYILGGALILVALLVGGQSILSQPFSWFAPHTASINLAPAVASPATKAALKIAGEPVQIIVPSRGINLKVIRGSYDQSTGNWTLSNDKAQFAVISSVANNRGGNTFIYGHDISQVFKRLEGLVAGDTAQIVTDNGYTFTYSYRSAVDVSPTNTSVFTAYTGAPILTLQTCSGVWSQNRHLMTFDFVGVQKS